MEQRSRLGLAYAHIFRALAWMVGILYLGQAVLAGQFLSGSYPALHLHQVGATTSDVVLFSAVVVGALLRWQTKGRGWPFWTSLGLLAANQVQNGAGASRMISLHVPLGVAMLAAAVVVALRSSQPDRLAERSTAAGSPSTEPEAGA